MLVLAEPIASTQVCAASGISGLPSVVSTGRVSSSDTGAAAAAGRVATRATRRAKQRRDWAVRTGIIGVPRGARSGGGWWKRADTIPERAPRPKPVSFSNPAHALLQCRPNAAPPRATDAPQRGPHAMRKPTHADAELLLHLYQMRRDEELRRAR